MSEDEGGGITEDGVRGIDEDEDGSEVGGEGTTEDFMIRG